MSNAMSRHRRAWTDVLRGRAGTAGIEFAYALPVLLLVALGVYEAYNYLRTVALIERAATSTANIISRQTASLRDCADTGDALNLGTYVAAIERITSPLPVATQGEVFLSAVRNNGNGPVVVWQRRSTFTLPNQSSVLGTETRAANLPRDVLAVMTPTSNITLIAVEVRYRFTPFSLVGDLYPGNPGEVTVSRIAYFRARTFNLQNLLSRIAAGCATALPTPPN